MTDTVRLPQSWQDWELTGLIGMGSYASVYEAVRKDDPSVRAAVKVIPVPKDESEVLALQADGLGPEQIRQYFDKTVDEFIREVKMLELFKGTPNIVSIEDYRVEPKEDGVGSLIFIRMELLTPLSSYLSGTELTEEETARIGIDLCSALSLCASRNLLHRDIKPENIFVHNRFDGHNFYKLGDFGISRVLEHRTETMSSRGTPFYVAPEVMRMERYDVRADIYSLGLTLYRLLNGNRLPFFPLTPLYTPSAKRDAVQRRLDGEKLPPPANASPEMAAVILKACSFRPEDRFQTADEMKEALEKLLAPKQKKNRTPLLIALAAVLLLACLAGWLLLRRQPRRQADVLQLPTQTQSPAPASFEATDFPAVFVQVAYVTDKGYVLARSEYRLPESGAVEADTEMIPDGYELAGKTSSRVWLDNGAPVPAYVEFTVRKKATPTAVPTATPTAAPTATPTPDLPTATPTPVLPSNTPTAVPTATPTTVLIATLTATPTVVPTATPTAVPTATPTIVPTASPTVVPTATPTTVPTATPTVVPTATPTAVPTATPTAVPTATPTAVPTASPTVVPTATPAAVPTAQAPLPQIGDRVCFGHYPQDYRRKTQEIVWQVLNVQDGRALLLSAEGLEVLPFNELNNSGGWAGSSIRRWLNEDFYQTAFSKEERAAIVRTKVDNSPAQGYAEWTSLRGETDTEDDLFLLSYQEAFSVYFQDDEARRCSPTRAALAGMENDPPDPDSCVWWLRSPGKEEGRAACVWFSGARRYLSLNAADVCVRPALWVDLTRWPLTPR